MRFELIMVEETVDNWDTSWT